MLGRFPKLRHRSGKGERDLVWWPRNCRGADGGLAGTAGSCSAASPLSSVAAFPEVSGDASSWSSGCCSSGGPSSLESTAAGAPAAIRSAAAVKSARRYLPSGPIWKLCESAGCCSCGVGGVATGPCKGPPARRGVGCGDNIPALGAYGPGLLSRARPLVVLTFARGSNGRGPVSASAALPEDRDSKRSSSGGNETLSRFGISTPARLNKCSTENVLPTSRHFSFADFSEVLLSSAQRPWVKSIPGGRTVKPVSRCFSSPDAVLKQKTPTLQAVSNWTNPLLVCSCK